MCVCFFVVLCVFFTRKYSVMRGYLCSDEKGASWSKYYKAIDVRIQNCVTSNLSYGQTVETKYLQLQNNVE